MKQKRISRTLVITIVDTKETTKIIAAIDKKQYVLISYLIRGMKIRTVKTKETLQIIPPSKDELDDPRFWKGVRGT